MNSNVLHATALTVSRAVENNQEVAHATFVIEEGSQFSLASEPPEFIEQRSRPGMPRRHSGSPRLPLPHGRVAPRVMPATLAHRTVRYRQPSRA